MLEGSGPTPHADRLVILRVMQCKGAGGHSASAFSGTGLKEAYILGSHPHFPLQMFYLADSKNAEMILNMDKDRCASVPSSHLCLVYHQLGPSPDINVSSVAALGYLDVHAAKV